MSDGLLSGVLPWVYSQGDWAKRQLNGLLADPIGTAQQAAGQLQDQGREQAGLLNSAFANPQRPLQVTDQNALAQLVDRTMAGPMGFAPVGMVAPRAEALETARKNAVQMLGLAENNTAMDRAQAMGFYDGWKHGSPNPNIQAFDPIQAGRRGVDFGPATYATKNGDNASGYALNWEEFAQHPAKKEAEAQRQDILNRFVAARQAGNMEQAASIRGELQGVRDGDTLYDDFLNYKVPSDGSTVYPLMIRADDMPWVDAGRKNFGQVNSEAISNARQAGAPGVRINDVADNSGRFNGTSDVMAVFDPSRIRSRFAAFDPARAKEADILGRASPALLGLLGLGSAGAAYLSPDRK